MATREEHLAWCKARALEYVDAGETQQAFTSMASDLNKHPDTQDHPACALGLMMIMSGQLKSPEQMRSFINGFN